MRRLRVRGHTTTTFLTVNITATVASSLEGVWVEVNLCSAEVKYYHSRDIFVLGPWYLFQVARGVFVCVGADICAVFVLLFVLLHYIWSLWHKLRARSVNRVGYFLHSKFFRNGCSSFLQQGHSGE